MERGSSLTTQDGLPRQIYTLDQKPLLTENWKAVLGLFDENDPLNAMLRYVKVFEGLAILRHKAITIQTPVGLPDGCYTLMQDNRLAYSGACGQQRAIRLNEQISSELVSHQSIQKLLGWVNWRRTDCKDLAGHTIIVDRPGFIDSEDKTKRFQFASIENPEAAVLLPIRWPIVVNSYHLRLALLEALRYDTVVFAYQRNQDPSMPLFIGVDWSRCVLLSGEPAKTRHKGPHGQLVR